MKDSIRLTLDEAETRLSTLLLRQEGYRDLLDKLMASSSVEPNAPRVPFSPEVQHTQRKLLTYHAGELQLLSQRLVRLKALVAEVGSTDELAQIHAEIADALDMVAALESLARSIEESLQQVRDSLGPRQKTTRIH